MHLDDLDRRLQDHRRACPDALTRGDRPHAERFAEQDLERSACLQLSPRSVRCCLWPHLASRADASALDRVVWVVHRPPQPRGPPATRHAGEIDIGADSIGRRRETQWANGRDPPVQLQCVSIRVDVDARPFAPARPPPRGVDSPLPVVERYLPVLRRLEQQIHRAVSESPIISRMGGRARLRGEHARRATPLPTPARIRACRTTT